MGAKLTFENPEELQLLINDYFDNTPEEEITITGLCLHLGIVKDTFYNYAKREDYKHIINMARLRVENSYEISLRRNGRTGDIFALKNFGWRDTQEQKTEVQLVDNITPLINMLSNKEESNEPNN